MHSVKPPVGGANLSAAQMPSARAAQLTFKTHSPFTYMIPLY